MLFDFFSIIALFILFLFSIFFPPAIFYMIYKIYKNTEDRDRM